MVAIDTYIDNLNREYKTHLGSEHAYRPALKALFDGMEKSVNAVNDGKRIAVGAPDLIVLKHNIPVGITEAKDIGVSLDREENSEQMGRYQKVGNVILTDYLEFRWYVNGEKRETVRVGEVRGKKIEANPEQFGALETMLKSFLIEESTTIRSARELAERMAGLAQLIRQLIEADLKSAEPSRELVSQMAAFQQTLLPEMQHAEFADMFAQTLAYGLFAARVEFTGERFSRYDAARYIPPTNPFLRRLFHDMSFDVGDKVNWLVDRLAELLAHTDTDEVLKDFGKATRQTDPVVHFYETFLSEYDPHLRDKRGVYYTPEPVVSYIVRSVDSILKQHFGRANGLADENTMILDPATGTGTFLYFVIEHIYEQMAGQRGTWKSYVRDHLLPRIFGFELLMAPYTVAHMKLGLQLREKGYDFPDNRRLGIYLTNTLEEGLKRENVVFAQTIVDEANQAAAIKREKPIMAVIGNPPYSGHSSNTGDWISHLIQDYYKVDGQPLGERNPKWLQNDYVKFIRFGQWRIEQTGSGVLAFITDNSYLDSVTFRGMRQQLLQSFSNIYILNLHGNSHRRETAEDGSQDENVFDIMQGVSIVIFIKQENKDGLAQVYYLDLLGKRQDKYDWLLNHSIDSTEWQIIKPISPYYFFIPRDNTLKPEYEEGWKIADVFPLNNVGVVTGQDKKTIGYTLEEARELVDLHKLDVEVIKSITYRPFDYRYIVYDSSVVTRNRFTTMRNMIEGSNIGLVFMRQVALDDTYSHFGVSSNMVDNRAFYSNKGIMSLAPLYLYPEKSETENEVEAKEESTQPLTNQTSMDAFLDDADVWKLSHKGRRPNLNPEFVKAMEGKLGLKFVSEKPSPPAPLPNAALGEGSQEMIESSGVGSEDEGVFYPEDVFHYAYAVFHSPRYRERYAEFLKIDFPRLPLTGDVSLFRQLCAYGEDLVKWHLLSHADKSKSLVTFDVGGDGDVAAGYPRFELSPIPNPSPDSQGKGDNLGRVYINREQYFANVPQNVWEFHIGGYQVLEKWLKDRRGRKLSYQDVGHYRQIVKALQMTIITMSKIDEAIPSFPIA